MCLELAACCFSSLPRSVCKSAHTRGPKLDTLLHKRNIIDWMFTEVHLLWICRRQPFANLIESLCLIRESLGVQDFWVQWQHQLKLHNYPHPISAGQRGQAWYWYHSEPNQNQTSCLVFVYRRSKLSTWSFSVSMGKFVFKPLKECCHDAPRDSEGRGFAPWTKAGSLGTAQARF